MKASEWIASLQEWGKYEKHIFDTDYLILKIEQEVEYYEKVDKDDIRRFADECDLFYYASYGKEYVDVVDGERVVVNEDEEWSNLMRQDFEEWVETVTKNTKER